MSPCDPKVFINLPSELPLTDLRINSVSTPFPFLVSKERPVDLPTMTVNDSTLWCLLLTVNVIEVDFFSMGEVVFLIKFLMLIEIYWTYK